MRLGLFAIVAVSASAVQAQVKLDVLRDGKKLGVAHYSQTIRSDGSKLVEVLLELKDGSRMVYVRTRSEYSAKGVPIRMFQARSVSGTTERRQTTVEFNERGARAGRTKDGAMGFHEVPLEAASPRENPSLFWFSKSKPKLNEEIKFYEFDIEKLAWGITAITYKGMEEVSVAGKVWQANKVETEHGDQQVIAYLDQSGLPIFVSMGDTQMVRA